MIRLTIITINYNNVVGLRKTLESVSFQDCTDFEHVIVDGGSADGSQEVIQTYHKSTRGHSINWVSEPDSGIYNAMNKGIRMATGEYLLFLNSGDWLYSRDVIQKFNNLDIDEEIVAGKEYFTSGFVYIPPKNDELSYDLLMEWPLMHQSTFIKRSAFDIYGMYDESYKIGGDRVWWLKAIVAGNATYRDLDFFVANFDQSGISSSSDYADLRKIERERIANEVLPRVESMRQELIRLRAVEKEFVFLRKGRVGWLVRMILYMKRRKNRIYD